MKIDTKSVGENAVVEQAGKKLAPESDGSYIIEFMAKSLKVRKAGSDDVPGDSTVVKDSTAVLRKMTFANLTWTKFSLFDLNGNCLGETNGWNVPVNYPQGAYVIRAEALGRPAATRMVYVPNR